MPDDVRLEEALAAFGRSSLRLIALMDINDKLKHRVGELETLIDKLRYENHELKQACHKEIADVRAQKAETVTLSVAEELEPDSEEVRITKPVRGNPPLRL